VSTSGLPRTSRTAIHGYDQDPLTALEAYAIERNGGPVQQLSREEYIAKQAQSLVRQGKLSRAAKVLSRDETKLTLTQEEVVEQLRTLHPHSNTALPALPTEGRVNIVVDEKVLLKMLDALAADGKAPGPSQMTYDHLRMMVTTAPARQAVIRIVQGLINGTIHPSISEFMSRSLLVAPAKTSIGPSNRHGRKSVQCGFSLRDGRGTRSTHRGGR